MGIMNLRKRGLMGLAFGMGVSALALSAAPAFAQETELPELIVTAQRRSENLQAVPLSVTVESAEKLQAIFSTGDDVVSLAARSPGLYAESSNGRAAPRFYIRGLGNTDFDLAASQPVSIIMDDVVMENVVLKSSPLYDLDQVEILRGPQGSLFGRNTTAGIIKFDSVKPSAETKGRATASYGDFNTFNFDGGLGGTIVDGKLEGRISALYQHRDDWISNSFTGQNDSMGGYDEKAARAQLLWTPTDDLSLLFNLHARDLDGTSAMFRGNILTKGSNSLNSSYKRDTVAYDGGGGNNQTYKGWGGSINAVADLGDVKVTLISAYEETHGASRGDIDGTAGPYTFNFGPGANVPGTTRFPSDTTDGLDSLSQWTEELRFSGGSTDSFAWQAGVYYFDGSFTINTNPGFPPIASVQQTNHAWAGFAHGTWALGEKLSFEAGARYTNDEKKLTVLSPTGVFAPVEVSDGKVSWDLSARYEFTDNVSAYVRVAEGFRGPSIQGRDVAFGTAPSTADSETVLSWEAGLKSELFDRRVRLNGAVFTYKIDDMQLTAVGGIANTTRLLNAHQGKAYGFEVDGEWLVNENLTLTAGYSYNHTEINDPNLTVAGCGNNLCTLLDPSAGNNNVYINGNPFPQAPEYIVDFTARYSLPVGDGGEVFAFTDWNQQGQTNLFLYRSKEFMTDGNFEGGLKIGYARTDGSWEAAVFVRNITDEDNIKGGIDFDNLTAFVNDPRIIGVTLTAKLK
jgi:iron complex outermembrane receptor protein